MAQSLQLSAFNYTTPAGVQNVESASASYALTSRPTLLLASPTGYGMRVSLPDATTMAVGAIVHAIDNSSDYPVRVANRAGTLLGFVPPKTYCPIGLSNNSTLAGIWEIANSRRDGIASVLATTVLNTQPVNTNTAIDLDGDIEIIYGSRAADNFLTAVAHRSSTGTYGTPVVIRSAAVSSRTAAIKHTSTQVLFVSCDSTTALEAVIVSVNAQSLALTVNTAATATLPANIGSFRAYSALLALPSLPDSFVISYRRGSAPGGNAIRAISISGTTVTIGSETVLTGTDSGGGLGAATGDKVIFVSNTSATLSVQPFTVSGSTLTAGTAATDATAGTVTLTRLFALGSRWVVLMKKGEILGAVITLSGTTATVSLSTALLRDSNDVDAIVVSPSKALVVGGAATSTGSVNILTDNAGTASVGTAIDLTVNVARQCLWATSSTAAISTGAAGALTTLFLDVSGASPTITRQVTNALNSSPVWPTAQNNLTKSAGAFYGSTFARKLPSLAATVDAVQLDVNLAGAFFVPGIGVFTSGNYAIGRNDLERWLFTGTGANDVIIKLECAA